MLAGTATAKLLAESLAEMITHLRMAREGGLLIVATDNPMHQVAVADELRRRVADEVRVVEFTFTPGGLSLSYRLRTLPVPDGRVALFVYGLEDLSPRDRETAIHSLNWGRERLGWAGYSVVLWVRPETITDLAFQAPDFFAWRSAAYIVELPEDEAQRAEALAILRMEGVANLDELRRRYLDYLLATYRWLDFRGLLQVRRILRMPLEEVYVPLHATTQNYVSARSIGAYAAALREEADVRWAAAWVLQHCRRKGISYDRTSERTSHLPR